MKDNKGYTLIELIVSLAILAVVSLGLMSFMLYGTRMYNDISTSIRLQNDSQVLMNQIREYVVDCDKGIVIDGNTVYVWNEGGADGSGGDTVHVFRYDAAAETIYFGSDTVSEIITASTVATDKLAENVTSFSMTAEVSGTSTAVSATLSLSMKQASKEYNGTQVIALRNRPDCTAQWSSLWNLLK